MCSPSQQNLQPVNPEQISTLLRISDLFDWKQVGAHKVMIAWNNNARFSQRVKHWCDALNGPPLGLQGLSSNLGAITTGLQFLIRPTSYLCPAQPLLCCVVSVSVSVSIIIKSRSIFSLVTIFFPHFFPPLCFLSLFSDSVFHISRHFQCFHIPLVFYRNRFPLFHFTFSVHQFLLKFSYFDNT